MSLLKVALIALAFDASVARSEFFKAIQGCGNDYKRPIEPISTSVTSSKLRCVSDCLQTTDCGSVNVCWDSNILTCEKMNAASKMICDDLQISPGCSFYEKVQPTCQNGGTYIESTESCDCVFGFTGDWCERYYYDCQEAYEKIQETLGVLAMVIQPSTSPHPFTVTCKLLSGGGLTYITRQLSSDPQLDFNKSWEEMKHPFGDPLGNYWLGLENIHYLTTQRSYILNYYMTKEDGDDAGHSLYTRFRIGDEASGYKFQYNVFYDASQVPDDAFGIDGVNGPKDRPYATYEHPDPNNCVVSQGVSWWYGQACPNYNLHLPLYDGSAPVFITWPVAGNTGTWGVREYVAQLIPNWLD